MQLHKLSCNQKKVIKNIKDYNILVNSVAGSGKTTTSLHIGHKYNNKNILLLTYSSRLKDETRKKAKLHKINNMEVHSYHSFCVKYYDNLSFTDATINNILHKKSIPLKIINYDIIILDEAQDISKIYYELVCKINNDNTSESKLCIIGDEKQSIFDFNGADHRYITHAHDLFLFNKCQFIKISLSESFRVTNDIALFINNVMLNDDRIKSNKKGDKPRYIICDTFGDTFGEKKTFNRPYRPYDEIMYYLDKGYQYDDIFVLAPSVKSAKCPCRHLANILSNKNIPIFVPCSDEEQLDEKVLNNKIVFSSFHQVKGLERKVVIIFNFDTSYFKYYNTKHDKLICPNTLYVAVTRASEQLTLFHNNSDNFLQFIYTKNIVNNCYFENNSKNVDVKNDTDSDYNKRYINISATGICKYLPAIILENAKKYLQIKEYQKKSKLITIDNNIKQLKLFESVSNITGTAIPAYFELKHKQSMTIFDKEIDYASKYDNYIRFYKNNECRFIDEENLEEIEHYKFKLSNITSTELLFIANYYISKQNGYEFKLKQIKDYNWLTQNTLDKCVDRIDNHVSKTASYEIKYESENILDLNHKIIGIVDCIDEDNMWEFKCVGQLQDSHFIQLGVYMYLHETKKKTQIKELKKKIQKLETEFKNEDLKPDDIITFKYTQIEEIIKIQKNGTVIIMLNDKRTKIKKNDIHYRTETHIHFKETKYRGFIKSISKTGEIIVCEQTTLNYKICKIKKDDILLFPSNLIIKNRKEKKKFEISKLYNELNLLQKKMNYYLFNILDNQIFSITSDLNKLEEMIKYLILEKNNNNNTLSNSDFIESNIEIFNKYNELHISHIETSNNALVMNNISEDNIISTYSNDNIMIIDIETNGLHKDKLKIVQIAYHILDKKLKCFGKYNYIINDESGERDFKKKISSEIIMQYGQKPEIVLNILNNHLKICKYIVGHNIITFDIPKIKEYFIKYNIQYDENIKIIDTMRQSKNYVNAKNIRGCAKMPNLNELYFKLFSSEMSTIDYHLADYDVEITTKCFRKLVSLKIINIYELDSSLDNFLQ